jgi:hypothetical protein
MLRAALRAPRAPFTAREMLATAGLVALLAELLAAWCIS